MSNISFRFNCPNRVIINLKNDIDMQIIPNSIATAEIYFLKEGQIVDVPKNIKIVDTTYGYCCSPVFQTKHFVLGWTSSFEIKFDEKLIVSLINNRDWDPDYFLLPVEERTWNIFCEKNVLYNCTTG